MDLDNLSAQREIFEVEFVKFGESFKMPIPSQVYFLNERVTTMANQYKAEEWKNQIEEACNSSRSMMEAASKLPMNYKTFRRLATELGLFNTNQSGKGETKNRPKTYTTEDILNGYVPHYQSFKLKIRLLKEGYKDHICENCGNSEWLGNPISLELHHIDGNNNNHSLENLKLLCPNCHALTETYRSKNRKV